MSKQAHEVLKEMSAAIIAGQLDARGDVSSLPGDDAALVALVNGMADALVAPLKLAGNALSQIAKGELPPFVIEEYVGPFNEIKQNINILLAILYGMHGETAYLVNSIKEGKLKTRGNDWDYQGVWKDLISGMNMALDSTIAPIAEAGEVLNNLAHYDLNSRMTGKYRGEHASIRKAMNKTAESLHGAITQVSDSVKQVSEVGRQISKISTMVSEGAGNQSVQLNQTSMSIASLSETASHSNNKTARAKVNAKNAADAISRAKNSMGRMLNSMGEISEAAEKTTTIAQEIDGIAKETGVLASSAVEKAVRMRISAGGFGVVAQEIRKLSRLCSETATSMKEFERKMSEDQRTEFNTLIANLIGISRQSNLLGVNASIEAAHVEGAGNEFKVMTDQIHDLAARSADAARKTSTITTSAATLSRNGVKLSQAINNELEDAVQGAHAISEFADEISGIIHEQTAGLEQISKTAMEISEVTMKNSEGATEALSAAKNLEGQVDKLNKMVQQFKF